MRTKRNQADSCTLLLPFKNCKHCNQPVDEEKIECSNCGMLYFEMAHRHNRNNLHQIISANFNGEYNLLQNPDKTLNCTCHSFLLQRGIQNGFGSTCKHIRGYLKSHPKTYGVNLISPAPYQMQALKELEVEDLQFISADQANFVINENLARQGIGDAEFMRILQERGQIEKLPLYPFGVEFEGTVKENTTLLLNALNQNNIPTVAPGYTHEVMSEWKIVPDGSVRADEGYQAMELVSPKLHGVEGFNKIKKALSVWKEVGGKVNVTTGCHVHVDAFDLSKTEMLELAKIWAKIESKVLWYLVSPSRRNGSYCKRVDRQYLVNLSIQETKLLDRRYSLNCSAFARYKTIEFRLHNGTLNPKKIIPWIILLLKLVASVRKGLTHVQMEPTLSGVLDSIGMKEEGSVQILRVAREALVKRFEELSMREKLEPQNEVPVDEIHLDGLEEEIENERIRIHRENILRLHDQENRNYRGRGVSPNQADRPANSVNNLASQIPSQNIRLEAIESSRQTGGTWLLPSSRNSATRHTVTLDSENDQMQSLSCTCRGFRSHQHCYHTINIARYLAIRQIIEERNENLS